MVEETTPKKKGPSLKDALKIGYNRVDIAKEAALKEAAEAKPFVVPKGFLKGKKADKERLAGVVERLSKSFTGSQLLEKAKSNGYVLEFVDGMDSLGVCDQSKKTISLSTSVCEGDSVITLAHELRHAAQFANGMSLHIDVDDTKTQIQINRAMEADAEAHAGLVAWQLKTEGDERPWDGFKRDGPKVADAIEGTISTLGKGKVRADIVPDIFTNAFKSWYSDYDIRESYDKQHLNLLKEIKEDNMAGDLAFDRGCDVDIIVSKVCRIGGEVYLLDPPEILDSKEMLSVSKSTMKGIEKFFEERSKEYDRDIDTSLKEIPTYDAKERAAKEKVRAGHTKSVYWDPAKKKAHTKKLENSANASNSDYSAVAFRQIAAKKEIERRKVDKVQTSVAVKVKQNEGR